MLVSPVCMLLGYGLSLAFAVFDRLTCKPSDKLGQASTASSILAMGPASPSPVVLQVQHIDLCT